MRTPYVIGRWVRGDGHYGRVRLIDYLLHGPDTAIWLVGTRRMGKTSMLRHLELLSSSSTSQLVPLYWDMQGSQSAGELSAELVESILDARERFEALGVAPNALEGQDAPAILRSLNRVIRKQNKLLLLLIDEAEVLIRIAQENPEWVGRLRKSLQDERQRTVMTSTKLLARLNRVSSEWRTSPFLFGFSMVSLPRLEEVAARGLVCQSQAEAAVVAHDSVVDNILIHTDGNPYLIQLLCNRLFTTEAHGNGTLRAITDADLDVDHILAGLFEIDYQHLVRSERRLLLAVAELTVAKESELLVRLSDLAPSRIKMFLYGLSRLGMVRRVFGQWAIGNEFLRRWIAENFAELERRLPDSEDDGFHELLLETGRQQEGQILRREITRIEVHLVVLKHKIESAEGDDLVYLLEEAERMRRELARLRRELAAIEEAA